MLILIAHCEGVIFADLVVKSRTQIRAHAWICHRVAEVNNMEVGVKNFCTHNVEVVDVPALEIKEKRRLLGQWSTDASAELRGLVTRRLHARRSHFEGVARIESRGVPRQKQLPVKFVRARLGKNLDSPVAEFVVLRGKRILVNSNL